MEYRLSMPDVRWRVCERLLDGIDFTNIESCWCIIVLTLSLLPDVNSGAGYSNKCVWFRDFSELPSTKIQILDELAVRPYYSVYVLMHRASPQAVLEEDLENITSKDPILTRAGYAWLQFWRRKKKEIRLDYWQITNHWVSWLAVTFALILWESDLIIAFTPFRYE